MSEGAAGGRSSWDCLRLRDEDEEVVADGGRGWKELPGEVAAVGSVVGWAGAASLAEERVTLGGMSGRSTEGLVSFRQWEMGEGSSKAEVVMMEGVCVMDDRVLGWLTLRRLHLMNVRVVALAHPWSFLSQLHKRTERASLCWQNVAACHKGVLHLVNTTKQQAVV